MEQKDYIIMLEDSLDKKIHILKQLEIKNEQQKNMLENPELTPEEFEYNLQQKDNLVQQLNLLDDGFVQLYDRVKEELETNKSKYKTNILHIQEMIKQITDYHSKIVSQEQRNRKLVEEKFASVKKQARTVNKGARAISNYYQNMITNSYYDARMMDSKK